MIGRKSRLRLTGSTARTVVTNANKEQRPKERISAFVVALIAAEVLSKILVGLLFRAI